MGAEIVPNDPVPEQLTLELPTGPNVPVPVQAMDVAEMAPLTASCDAPTGPKLLVPTHDILAQETEPVPSALNRKVLPLNTLNPPLFIAWKPLLFAVTDVETILFE